MCEIIDNPQILYKYRSWTDKNHKEILLNNELYLASPKDFNDPFDCKIPPNYRKMSSEEKDSYTKEMLIKHRNDFDPSKYNDVYIQTRKKLDNPEFQKEFENLHFENIDKYYGILSLSSRWNSILMWSHYANYHEGFCVGFWKHKLSEKYFGDMDGKVDYKEIFPEIKPFVAKKPEDLKRTLPQQILTKAKDWQYENEYRFIHLYPTIPTLEDRKLHIDQEIIAEIILGIKITDPDKKEIIEICKRKSIPVYQARKKDFEFDIDKELI